MDTHQAPDTEGLKDNAPAWHSIDGAAAAGSLGTDPSAGLSADEAERRYARYGPNLLEEEKKTRAWKRFLGQFNDFMIYVLLAAVLISAVLLREFTDAAVIMVIVVLNAVLGYIQEAKAEKALEKLKQLSAPTVRVVRGGAESEVQADTLVPGDIVTLEAGDLVAADCRLLESVNLMVNESSLTGEATAADKDAEVVLPEDIPLGDRANMVFAGTHVQHGRGRAVVAETGARTQLGEIAGMLQESKPSPTPLQIDLREVGKRIVYLSVFIVAVVFVMGMIRGNEFAQMLLIAVSLAVAAIPEGLPAIVTITLAQGTQKMSEENAIIRNLPAVETLGSANYICSDKTGTLTLNRMTVSDVLFPDGGHYLLEDVLGDGGREPEIMREMAVAAALCNDARPGAEDAYLGDPTEVALLEAAGKAGVEKSALEGEHDRVAEVPFDSDRKMMTTVHTTGDGYAVYSKGAVEVLLARCDNLMFPGGARPLEQADRDRIMRETSGLGSQALRTIGVASGATGELPPHDEMGEVEKGLTFLGTFGMKDPPRKEVAGALETCRRAMIDVAMITGDHRATAEAVGRELDILVPGKRIIEGPELERMSAGELARQVEDIRVYARVSPRHKVKIVEALKERGHVVAMTGDGVNDAPALKRADIGVAMGITGTDVSKEASDMILADDNFATIVSAVRQGRIIFSNLKKFIYFLLSCNISEVLTVFVTMLLGYPLALLPVQILWINLATDGLPALALGVDPPERDVMEHPPRRQGENILAVRKLLWLGWQGVVITVGTLSSFILARYLLGFDWTAKPEAVGLENLDMARTILFSTLVFTQVLHAFNMRSETRSFFLSAPWKNRYLFGAALLSVGLQLAVLYVPFMQNIFGTKAPTWEAWLLILLCSFIPVLVIDRVKWLNARRHGA